MSDTDQVKPAYDSVKATKDAAEGAKPAADAADKSVARTDAGADEDAKRASADAVASDKATDELSDAADALHEPEPDAGGGLAATTLKFFAILLVGGVAALWAGPRIAPHLPAWAQPIAAFLTPGADAVEERLETFAARLDEVEASAGAPALAKAGAVENRLAGVEADLSARIETVVAQPRADVALVDDLVRRLAEAEVAVADLAAELDALDAAAGENAAPSSGPLAKPVLEDLKTEIAVVRTQAARIEGKADAAAFAELAKRVDALERGEAATAGAREDAARIRRAAGLEAALTFVDNALDAGNPYSEPLSKLENLSGETAPAILANGAGDGLPTRRMLKRAFSRAAQKAYSAALAEEAGDGLAARALAKLSGRLGGRPAREIDGDNAGAVLSRIEARLDEGRLEAALEQVSALSPAARAALGPWLAELKTAVGARSAFDAYRATLLQTAPTQEPRL